ncbi:Co-chaperone protein hscB [Rickettsiales bacterium Ac37b]|nr:Co-chaperone protein hscB [Rickettsiales bacterium Ac37b]
MESVYFLNNMSQDFFTLLNIDIEFDIDLNKLNRNYFQLQKQFHPDQHVKIDAQGKIQELEYSAKINEAYTTIKDPLSRAAYLLVLQGIEINENTYTIGDSVFLEKSMEDRELLQEVETLPILEKFEAEILSRQTIALKEFSECYKKKFMIEATEIYIQLKYITRLLEEISHKRRFINDATTHNK